MLDNEDNREKLREKVAAEHGFQLYRPYSERVAAETIGWDYSTLKRKRRAGLVPFVDRGGGSIAYLGRDIANIILFGVKAKDDLANNGTNPCPNTESASTASEIGGSGNATDRPPTTASATTPPSKAMSALALARRSLR